MAYVEPSTSSSGAAVIAGARGFQLYESRAAMNLEIGQ
jgi:hypothetical protein